MKTHVFFSILTCLFCLNPAVAGDLQVKAIVKSFEKDFAAKQALTKLGAIKNGKPYVVRLSGGGDKCALVESYLLIQPLHGSNNLAQHTLAARAEVSTFLPGCDESQSKTTVNVTRLYLIDLTLRTEDKD